MVDVLTKEQRHKCMAAIRSKNTKPERLLRSLLHNAGLRYRLHDKELPGSPDLVFPRFNAVIFVHGCYWHLHGCYKCQLPESNREFWKRKLSANKERDIRNICSLREMGFRVMIVWECALKGKTSIPSKILVRKIKNWLLSTDSRCGTDSCNITQQEGNTGPNYTFPQ